QRRRVRGRLRRGGAGSAAAAGGRPALRGDGGGGVPRARGGGGGGPVAGLRPGLPVRGAVVPGPVRHPRAAHHDTRPVGRAPPAVRPPVTRFSSTVTSLT